MIFTIRLKCIKINWNFIHQKLLNNEVYNLNFFEIFNSISFLNNLLKEQFKICVFFIYNPVFPKNFKIYIISFEYLIHELIHLIRFDKPPSFIEIIIFIYFYLLF